jgi:succinate-semialdehyde dehydrogenase/glutarate-semialdehyde dehydrogenase
VTASSVLSDREADLVGRVPTGLLVGGEWRPADSGGTLPVDDPSTGEVIAEVADGSVADGKAALDSAVAHQEEWAATPPRERG